MKTVLSILLGLMLASSTLAGISYATPIGNLQAAQAPNYNNCNLQQPPSGMNMNVTQVCHNHNDGGNGGRDQQQCVESITPHGLEVSDIQPTPRAACV